MSNIDWIIEILANGVHHLLCPLLVLPVEAAHFICVTQPHRFPVEYLMIFPVDGIVGQCQDTFSDQYKVAAIVQTVCVRVHPVQRGAKVYLIIFTEVREGCKGTAFLE